MGRDNDEILENVQKLSETKEHKDATMTRYINQEDWEILKENHKRGQEEA